MNQLGVIILLCILCLLISWRADGYGSGAGSNACNTLRPGDSHGTPSEDASPYTVKVLNNVTEYTPGTKISGRLNRF